jgi:hypothetical protein
MPLLMLYLNACAAQSAIYSPTANLPPEPQKKGTLQLLGSYGTLPEARPHKMKEDTAEAYDLALRISVTDWFTFQGKMWKDLSDVNRARGGYSLAGLFILKRDYHGFDFGIMPTGVIVGARDQDLGGGGILPLCVWFPNIGKAYPYATIGYGYGAYDINGEDGWVIISNLGAAHKLTDHITLNLELSMIRAHNNFEELTDYFIVPSINIGFNN